jgi:hypothetical protein
MWEYKMINAKVFVIGLLKKENEKVIEDMNELGKDGWELVTAFTMSGSGVLGTGGGTLSATLLFKRPIR